MWFALELQIMWNDIQTLKFCLIGSECLILYVFHWNKIYYDMKCDFVDFKNARKVKDGMTN
jgi:hypothetical protein